MISNFVITPIVRDPASEEFPFQPQIRWIDDLMGPQLSKVTDSDRMTIQTRL
jgi:hypothetical protein